MKSGQKLFFEKNAKNIFHIDKCLIFFAKGKTKKNNTSFCYEVLKKHITKYKSWCIKIYITKTDFHTVLLVWKNESVFKKSLFTMC